MMIMLKRVSLIVLVLLTVGGIAQASRLFFSDVPANYWAYDAIKKLSELHIISGYKDGTFRPGNNVTRAEVAQLIYNHDLELKKEMAALTSDDQRIINSITNTMPSVVIVKGSSTLGTGFFVDSTHVLTAKHVLNNEATATITTLSGHSFAGKAVKSSDSDLMLLEVFPTEQVKPVQFASSYMLGQTVVAIGNPQGLEYSVSRGIISNTDRLLDQDNQHYLQIDASVNPGNSGGPLIDSDGNVVGLVDAKISESGIEGIGFAIRLEEIKSFLDL